MTLPESFRVNLLPAAPALDVTRYSFIVPTTRIKELSFEFGTNGTGTTHGTWSFEGSDDPAAEADRWTEQTSGTVIGSSATAKWVAITAGTVYGSALAVNSAAATKSYVAFALGVPAYMRMLWTVVDGGTGSNSYCFANGKQ